MPDDWTIQPVLSSAVAQSGVADTAGTLQYQPASDIENAGDVAFAGPIADFILYGVVNGAFAQGPPDSSQNIEPINNPLPYWYGPVQVSGGAITASWVADSASPSGYNLRFMINAGAASDEAYFEQIVPVGGTRSQFLSNDLRIAVIRVAASGGTPMATLALQYLDVSGAALGSERSSTQALASGTLKTSNLRATALAPSATAMFLRVRIGVKRNTMADSDTATIDFTDVRIDPGRPYTAVPDVGSSAASYGPGYILQQNGVLQLYAASSVASALLKIDTTGVITLFGATVQSGIIFPSISAAQDDWAPTGWNTCSDIEVDCGGAGRSITGISATGMTEGQTIWISANNTGGGNLTLVAASAASASGNRFTGIGGANYVMAAGGGVAVTYLPTVSAANPWRIRGKS